MPAPSSALALAVAVAACMPGKAPALPALVSCQQGGRAGRWGLCTRAGESPSPSGRPGASAPTPIVLRGSNYIRLGGPGLVPDGYHSTFDATVYNRTKYNAVFKRMRADGYNILRVFLDELPGRGIGGNTSSTLPLDPAWVGRLAQFIQDAESFGLYTVVTLVYTPQNKYFANATQGIPQDPAWGASWNAGFLSARGHAGYVAYASVLAASLAARLTPAAQSATLVSLQNEYFLRGDAYPFTVYTGAVEMADGVRYDMGRAADRQQAADANTNLWASKLRAAIRAHLPSTLVTVGVFTFQAVHKAGPNGLMLAGCRPGAPVQKPPVDCRFPARPFWLAQAGLDFLDVHVYQKDGSPAALQSNLDTEEWSNIDKNVPIVMGEFGCTTQWYGSAMECVPHVRELQVSSCAAGFSGWLFWTYDTHKEQPQWYDMMVDDGGVLNDVLAPNRNPDPCKI